MRAIRKSSFFGVPLEKALGTVSQTMYLAEKLICSSSQFVSVSHLIYDLCLLHKKAKTLTSQTSAHLGNQEILTQASPGDDIHRGKVSAIQFRNIPHMDHVEKP